LVGVIKKKIVRNIYDNPEVCTKARR